MPTLHPIRLRPSSGLLAGVALAAACVAACGSPPVAQTSHEAPAQIAEIEGSDLSEIVLTARAAERLGIETATVQAAPGNGRAAIPYSAVFYDASGATWVYLAPRDLTFRRTPIEVESIAGQTAVLRTGLQPGATVVSVGVTELFGAEFQVGH